MRIEHYRYRFTSQGDGSGSSVTAFKCGERGVEVGKWWSRKRERNYFPQVNLKHPSFRQFLAAYGWLPQSE